MSDEITRLHDKFCVYSQVMKNRTPRTIKWFKEGFRCFMAYSGVTDVKSIDENLVEDWITDGAMRRGWSPQTIRNRLQTLSSFLEYCKNKGLLENNCTKTIPRPKLKQRVISALSKEEALKLMRGVRNYPYSYAFEKARNVAVIGMFILTGIRCSELLQLELHDVKIEEKTLYVRHGKGGKERVIPMNEKLIEDLKVYLKERARLGRNSPWFFISVRSNKPLTERAIRSMVSKIRDYCGVYFYPHKLRHTFATLMLVSGCDLRSLQAMLGHSSITMTERYLSAVVGHMQKQVRRHPLNLE